MPKFSIIIPVYNVEKYIKKCIDSIVDQTFKDYEVIIINDGSTDKSISIVKKYDVKIIDSEHVSVSEARNIGVKHAKGKYLIFIDSDDYWDKELLENINNNLDNNPDIVRFQMRTVTQDNEIINYNEESFTGLTGEEAFNKIVNFHFVESPCCYAIKRSYYEKEKFKFKEGTVHEDFGLIPLVVIKASVVNSIDYIGYNYFRRNGSIMTNPDYDWVKKKVNDFFMHYTYLIKEINKTNLNTKNFKSFVANSAILKITELKGEDYREYKRILKQEKVFDNLLVDTFPRKIKKILAQISPKLMRKIAKR